MRRAVWLRRAEDPRTPAEWVMGGNTRLPPGRQRVLAWLTLPTSVALIVLGVVFGSAGFVLGLVATGVGLACYSRPGAQEHAALPSLGGESYPVTIDVRHRGRRAGRDNGWVTFVDGWLVYEGLRTSFSFRTSDAESVRDLAGQLFIALPGKSSVRIFLLTDFMQTHRPARWRDRERFLESYSEWRSHPAPAGEPLLPPVGISPQMAGGIIGDRLALAAVVAVLGAFATTYGLPPAAVLAAVVSLGLLASAWRETRRLRRQLELPPKRRT